MCYGFENMIVDFSPHTSNCLFKKDLALFFSKIPLLKASICQLFCVGKSANRKSANFLDVPVRKSQIHKFLD